MTPTSSPDVVGYRYAAHPLNSVRPHCIECTLEDFDCHTRESLPDEAEPLYSNEQDVDALLCGGCSVNIVEHYQQEWNPLAVAPSIVGYRFILHPYKLPKEFCVGCMVKVLRVSFPEEIGEWSNAEPILNNERNHESWQCFECGNGVVTATRAYQAARGSFTIERSSSRHWHAPTERAYVYLGHGSNMNIAKIETGCGIAGEKTFPELVLFSQNGRRIVINMSLEDWHVAIGKLLDQAEKREVK